LKIKEKNLLRVLKPFLEEQGIHYKKEISFLERRIDIVGARGEDLFAFELKVSDWKRVLSQAITCKICCDYSYIAIWHENCPENLEKFEMYGIGVLAVSSIIDKRLEAKKSSITHKTLVKNMKSMIQI
jgi:hypothetical protein